MIRYILAVIAGGCSYGVLSTFIKTAYSLGFSEAEVISTQYLLGVMILWLAFLFTRKVRIERGLALKLLGIVLPNTDAVIQTFRKRTP